jgi:hypothetical protein
MNTRQLLVDKFEQLLYPSLGYHKYVLGLKDVILAMSPDADITLRDTAGQAGMSQLNGFGYVQIRPKANSQIVRNMLAAHWQHRHMLHLAVFQHYQIGSAGANIQERRTGFFLLALQHCLGRSQPGKRPVVY